MKGPKVRTESYRSEYERRGKDLFVLHRYIERTDRSVDIDSYCWWSLLCVEEVRGSVCLRRPESQIFFEEGVAIFIPAFRVVEWQTDPGVYRFTAYHSVHPLPDDLPREPILFRCEVPRQLSSVDEVFEAVRNRESGVPVGRESNRSAPARRAKEILDQRFKEEMKIRDLAREVRSSNPVLTKAFREAYGLSPLQYRNKLRLFEAQRLMLMESRSVADAAIAAGFSDISKFNKDFKRLMKINPATFKWHRRAVEDSPAAEESESLSR